MTDAPPPAARSAEPVLSWNPATDEPDQMLVRSEQTGTARYRVNACTRYSLEVHSSVPEAVDAVSTVLEDCLVSLPDLTDWLAPRMRRPQKVSGVPDKIVAEVRTNATDDIGVWAWSMPHPPRQQISVRLPSSWHRERDRSGYFVVGEPAARLFTDTEAVVERTIRHASLLRPQVGLVGLALMAEPGMEPFGIDEAWPVLERYPGLSVPYRAARGADGAGIPHVDWLTVLGEQPLRVLGGIAVLRRRLVEAATQLEVAPAEMIEYDGGVVLRAGPAPQLHEPRGSGAPLGYCAVDDALRPIRWDGRGARPNDLLKTRRKGVDAGERTRHWQARFERERV